MTSGPPAGGGPQAFFAAPPPTAGVLTRHVQPATMHAELTADRTEIVIIPVGSPNAIDFAQAQLELMTPMTKPTHPVPGGMVMPASWMGAIQLSMTYGAALKMGPALGAWMIEQLTQRSAAGSGALAVVPPAGCLPRRYQVEAAHMIGLLGSALLFDDPGTGKTVSAVLGIAESAHRRGRGLVLPVVVVCPRSVVDAWVRHFKAWAPSLRARAWRGSPAARKRMIGTADVYVTSYGTAREDALETVIKEKDEVTGKMVSTGRTRRGTDPLLRLMAKTIIADEVHLTKDPGSGQSRAVRRLVGVDRKSGRAAFLGLSGTPIARDMRDAWPAVACISPAGAPSRDRWKDRYALVVPGDYDERIAGLNPATEAEFRATLRGQYRRVSKIDVAPELPPKVYSQRYVELPPTYRKAYDNLETEMLAELPDDGGELSLMDALAMVQRLVQLSSAGGDVSYTFTTELDEYGNEVEKKHTHVKLRAPSWKVDVLLEILAERPGQPVLVFSQLRDMIDIAGQVCEKAGYRTGYIVGGQTPKARQQVVDDFQAGKLDVLVATTSAGGVGLTLTAAGTVVFLNRPWSMVDALQAEDRAHRIGSEHDAVEIIDIIAVDSVDDRIREVLATKAGALSEFIQDPRVVAQMLGGHRAAKPVGCITSPETAPAPDPESGGQVVDIASRRKAQ